VDRWFRRLQLVSAGAYSLGHGGNDAQKTIGIIWLLLIATGYANAGDAEPPLWTIVSCYLAIGLGTMFGGWRIVKTMGQKITKLKPVGGFCAESGGALTLFFATFLGVPVSTTHGRHRRRGLHPARQCRALGRGRQHRLGLGADHPRQRLRGVDCLLDQSAVVLIPATAFKRKTAIGGLSFGRGAQAHHCEILRASSTWYSK
jgi:hypothetical protein